MFRKIVVYDHILNSYRLYTQYTVGCPDVRTKSFFLLVGSIWELPEGPPLV